MIWFVHKAAELRAVRRYLIAMKAWELREAHRLEGLPETADRAFGIELRRERARTISEVLSILPRMPTRSGLPELDDPTPEDALVGFLEDSRTVSSARGACASEAGGAPTPAAEGRDSADTRTRS